MSPARKDTLSKWLPMALAIVTQVLGGVWFAAHESAKTDQNAKDIAELKLVVVRKPEFTEFQDSMKEQMHGMDSKLDILLTRTSK